MLYTVMKSDLHAMSRLNTLFKYVDDTTLVVPEHTDVSICDEFEHVKVWASVNKLVLKLFYEAKGTTFSYAAIS